MGWGVVVVEEQKILSLQVPNTSNITPSKCIIIFSTESILNWEFDNNLIEKQVRFHYVSIKLNFTTKFKVAESFIYWEDATYEKKVIRKKSCSIESFGKVIVFWK